MKTSAGIPGSIPNLRYSSFSKGLTVTRTGYQTAPRSSWRRPGAIRLTRARAGEYLKYVIHSAEAPGSVQPPSDQSLEALGAPRAREHSARPYRSCSGRSQRDQRRSGQKILNRHYRTQSARRGGTPTPPTAIKGQTIFAAVHCGNGHNKSASPILSHASPFEMVCRLIC